MKKENVYDGLFILNSDAYARNPEEVSGAIAKTIESFGGTVRVSRLFEERKLAYPIEGHKRGVYWLCYFRLATDQKKELDRQFTLNGNIIRFLITRLDPRLEEPLVQHALNNVNLTESAGSENVVVDVDQDEEDADAYEDDEAEE